MATTKGVTGRGDGTQRVRQRTRKTKAGSVTVRQNTNTAAVQTGQKTVSAPLATRSSMVKAGKGQTRATTTAPRAKSPSPNPKRTR